MGPAHPPYERSVVAPGHQLGFNDLKIIEAHELLNRILESACVDDRFRRRPRHRANHPRDRPLEPRRTMGRGGLMTRILRWGLTQRPIEEPEIDPL